jgi:type II secretory ATPase GspE/PulE/Tfp pilus assembly ATPase PilB-like protein
MGVRRARYVLADDEDLLTRLIAVNYPPRDAAAGALTSVAELAALFGGHAGGADLVLEAGGEGGLRGLVDHLLCEAVEAGASDVHIDPARTDLAIRLTVDGVCTSSTLVGLPAFFAPQVLSVVKQNAGLDIVNTRYPQSGSFTARVDYRREPRRMQFRVETTPTVFGEACTVRIFSAETQNISLEEICGDARTLDALTQVARQRHGMLVLSGPTGSGKNTTMYAVIEKVDRNAERVIAIEHPVEIVMDGVRAIPVNEEEGFTFPKALKSALRQAPRRLIVGEVRCRETADLAIRAAQTGHQVLTTVHAGDAPSTVPRLLKEGIEPHMLAAVLDVVVAQRLLGRVCRVCAEPVAYSDFVLLNEQLTPGELRALRELEREGGGLRRGSGCKVCRYTGLDGRVAIQETLIVTDEVRAVIEADEPGMEREVRRLALADGMVPLRRAALGLAVRGEVSFDEAVGLTKRIPEEDFRWMCGDDYAPPGERGRPAPAPSSRAAIPCVGGPSESHRSNGGLADMRGDRAGRHGDAAARQAVLPAVSEDGAGGQGEPEAGAFGRAAGLLPGWSEPLGEEAAAVESLLDQLRGAGPDATADEPGQLCAATRDGEGSREGEG